MDKISGNKITGTVRPDGLSKQEPGKPVKGSQIKDTFSHGVKTEPAGLMPKPAVEKKGKWTILKFTIVESGLGQELYDGLSMPGTKENVRVVSAEISDAGSVEKNYSWNASGKTEEKALSGKDANFEDFLKAAMKKYPAQHYMIAFDGHSSQFRPLVPKLNNAMKETGKKFDIIQFSSCTMAEADIASQFKDTADYLIASEGFTYSRSYLSDVKEWGNKNPEALNSAEKVAKEIIQKDDQHAHSVINLNKLQSFNKEIEAFGKEILIP
ncbi:MAG: clostripain-related cysteine peptidase [Chloroflexi bacterium]|nr:clostripain-related cysteine peptidase [Chloroflexota bacterium]